MTGRRASWAWAAFALASVRCAAPQDAPPKPLFSFGVVADIQYADKDGGRWRYYRDSLRKAAACVEAWNREDLDFAVDLGDLTDDRAEGTKEDLDRVLAAFKPLKAPLHHVLGNHGTPTAGRAAVMEALGLKEPYTEFARHGWRFILLDATGLHLKAWPAGSDRRAASEAYWKQHRGPGKPEFADYNGAIDPEQLRWLRAALARAAEKREPVIVFSHLPTLAEASSRSHLLWNHEEILGALESCPALVAFVAGHDHKGGYALRKGIHHVTLEGVVETPPEGNAFGIVSVYPDRLVIRGSGSLTSRTLPAAGAAQEKPDPAMSLELAAPVRTWDEAIPLGNGLLGGLLWGEGNILRLSLDRGDLWDERPARGVRWQDFTYATMQRLVRENRNNELNAIFDRPYGDAHPTKLPAGRLEITLEPARQAKSFELDLAAAEGSARFADGPPLRAFFSAGKPVALVLVPGPEPRALALRPPQSVRNLGYPPAQDGGEGRARWFLQEAAEGLRYCVCVDSRRDGDATLLAATVASTRDGDDPVGIARRRAADGLAAGYEAMRAPHLEWWKAFWAKSRVVVPDAEILRHYNLVRYFHGAASRRSAPPMPLQGVWTADSGSLPPWKGDYHNDLNTQMTYIAYPAAGHFEEGACYLDFLWDLLPTFRKFAKDFYDAPGAAVPGVMSLAGQPLGGWGHYSLSPTMGAWSGHLFYLHWRYTADDAFLRERAWPWCREVGACLLHLLKPDEKGVLKLPLSTSPEIHDNSARAWLRPNTNYDLACLRMFFLALSEMADACGEAAESKKWKGAADALGDFHRNAEGALKLDEKEDLAGSHRHLSNIIAIHPFNLIHAEGGEKDRPAIAASLRQWDRLGTGAWCGYSFSWMSCLRARAGDAEAALRNLEIYARAFILRNGFHANGDQTRSGFSGFTYRPFTLEGNFLAMQAVHEMLLQSWSPRPGVRDTGILRVFPAVPWRWHDAEFADLRAEGGHRVSARRENNGTTWLRVVAGRDGVVRVRDNFGGRAPRWSREGVRRNGDLFEVALKRGEVLEATLPRPAAVPEKPAGAAEPVVIAKARAIRPNRLPLRIGADSNGENRFRGDIARASVFNRALAPEEVRSLADPASSPAKLKGCVVTWDFEGREGKGFPGAGAKAFPAEVVGDVTVVEAGGGLGRAARLDGRGYLTVPHDPALDCLEGLTLEVWIRPEELPPSGARILDKSPAGAATAYLLDTYPRNSLRLIIRDPHLRHDARLSAGQWVHVAATVDAAADRSALYVAGRKVAED